MVSSEILTRVCYYKKQEEKAKERSNMTQTENNVRNILEGGILTMLKKDLRSTVFFHRDLKGKMVIFLTTAVVGLPHQGPSREAWVLLYLSVCLFPDFDLPFFNL